MQSSHTDNLLRSKGLIATALRKYGDDLQTLKNSTKTTLQDLLKTAKGIQLNCHAPNEYRIGMQLFNCHPPAPQPEEMRAGELALYQTRQRRATVKTDAQSSYNTGNNPLELLQSLRSDLGQKRTSETLNNQRDRSAIADGTLTVQDNTIDFSVQETVAEATISKKARTVNISFGLSDSEDSASDED